MIAGLVSIHYGYQGPNFGTVSACSSANHSLGEAARLIEYGDADVMIAGGAEATVSALVSAAFARRVRFRIATMIRIGKPAWDIGRDGFVLGEGAGVLVLEDYEHARARGARIYCELVGYGMSADAHHITSPPDDGHGAARSMTNALKNAQMNPDAIDYINAHGTSTQLGDIAECIAVKRCFGDHAARTRRIIDQVDDRAPARRGRWHRGGVHRAGHARPGRAAHGKPRRPRSEVRSRFRPAGRAQHEDKGRDVELVRVRRHQCDTRVPRDVTRNSVGNLHCEHADDMALIVQKYGGTSVGTIERIRNVARRVARFHHEGHQLVVVVSAMSGETNRLLALAREISVNPNPRELDVVAATGEQVTIGLLAIALDEMGINAKSYNGAQVRIVTDSAFTKARILSIDEKNIRADLDARTVVVVAGFQGVDADGNVTTLGRGGSDTSGVALAAALKADECQIYTDVDGVYTTDPRIVPAARRLEKITFEEMLEMSSLGSKVLQIRAVEFAGKYNVKLRVLSSFEDPEVTPDGTLITFEEDENMEQAIISGIAFNRDEAKISVMGVEDKPGVAYAILGPIAAANIDVDMIVQNIGASGHTDFSFTVPRSEYQKRSMCSRASEARHSRRASSSATTGSARCPSSASACARTSARQQDVQDAGRRGINIQMISTSEIKISVVIDEKYLELAVRVLHRAFGLEKVPGRG
jgi:aspartate kinase